MVAPTKVDDALFEFATERQSEILRSIQKHGGARPAAEADGACHSHYSRTVKAVMRKAARAGHAPGHFVSGVAPGYLMGKVTVQRGSDGAVERTWERQSPEALNHEALIEALKDALADGLKGLAPIVPPPERTSAELICVVPVGDPHFGMYAWAEECGADFDSEIATRLSEAAADRLVASMPNCSVGVLLLLGDILHANDQSNQTPGHKNQLDVDTRFVRVLRVTIQTWRRVLLRMAEKCGTVVGKLIPGNHDPQSVWALAYALAAYFENDPRIQIDLGPSKFWYYSFGKVLIGATHGDTVKPEKLPGIMAADKPAEWGAATHRYWYTGHIHSKNAMEFPGVQWESFRTLAPADSYAASHGYRSGRDMVAIIHHHDHGEIERHRVDAGMLA